MIVMEQNDKIFRCNASKHQIFSFVLADATKMRSLPLQIFQAFKI